MQTNTLRIDSWDTLYTMFTTLEPEDRRMAVLQAIADPSTTIGHSWDDCLFAVAARAANNSIKSVNNFEVAAEALGIPAIWVDDGISLWDGRKKDLRNPDKSAKKQFRERIRAHLKRVEKAREAADGAVSEARQTTRFVEKVKRSFRELTGV